MAFSWVINAHGPSLQRTACRSPTFNLILQQEVTRPKGRYKPTLPEKSGVDGGAFRCQ